MLALKDQQILMIELSLVIPQSKLLAEDHSYLAYMFEEFSHTVM